MSIIIENEYEGEINIPYEKIAHEVIEAAIDYVDCPYECEVNLMLTDNDTIHEINKEQRKWGISAWRYWDLYGQSMGTG